MKLRFTARAAQDITDIADYIRAENPRAAQRVRATILETLALIGSFPNIGRRQSVEGVRKLATRKYSYLIYYTADEAADELIILTIQHPARDRQFSDE
jgi:toxin ParE1/3/4